MDPTTEAAASGSEQTPVAIPTAPAPAGDGAIGAREAARSLANWRHKRNEQTTTDQPADPAAPAAEKPAAAAPAAEPPSPDRLRRPSTESEAAQAADDAAAADAQPPGETESAGAEAEQLPPIEPPRSWTKEDKELFNSLPRATQENIAQRERARDADFSRRQQQATEQAKALEAERLRMEQARVHYESTLPQLLQNLLAQQAGEFADIKTVADIERLAREDTARYLQWDLSQKKIAGLAQETMAAAQRQAAEKQQQFSEFARRQDDLFTEKVPDMADADKAAKLQSAAIDVLKELGFEEAELAQSWNGAKEFSLRDHRLQLIIRDAVLWREAQAKARAAALKPVPPVQRPGASPTQAVRREAELQTLSKRLDQTGSLKDAAAFVRARRAAR
jgi:hypothetical protein